MPVLASWPHFLIPFDIAAAELADSPGIPKRMAVELRRLVPDQPNPSAHVASRELIDRTTNLEFE